MGQLSRVFCFYSYVGPSGQGVNIVFRCFTDKSTKNSELLWLLNVLFQKTQSSAIICKPDCYYG